jgi:hypothetical protein
MGKNVLRRRMHCYGARAYGCTVLVARLQAIAPFDGGGPHPYFAYRPVAYRQADLDRSISPADSFTIWSDDRFVETDVGAHRDRSICLRHGMVGQVELSVAEADGLGTHHSLFNFAPDRVAVALVLSH